MPGYENTFSTNIVDPKMKVKSNATRVSTVTREFLNACLRNIRVSGIARALAAITKFDFNMSRREDLSTRVSIPYTARALARLGRITWESKLSNDRQLPVIRASSRGSPVMLLGGATKVPIAPLVGRPWIAYVNTKITASAVKNGGEAKPIM